jgi:curved DNA-binding protein
MASDPYKILGVASSASGDEIKKAYRKLAKQFHPDSTGGDKTKESRFKDISNAYDILGDDKKRQQYDAMRSGRGQPGFSGGQGFAGGQGGDVFDIGDLFGQFFGGASATNTREAGRGSSRVRVDNLGGNRRHAQRQEPAPPPEAPTKVKASDGSELTVIGADVHSDLRISFDRAILGTVATVATLTGKGELKVPPGTCSGRKMRLRGKGLAVQNGATGQTGDHYVTVQIDVPSVTDDEGSQLVTQLAIRLAAKRG